jgi:hypothetical protein
LITSLWIKVRATDMTNKGRAIHGNRAAFWWTSHLSVETAFSDSGYNLQLSVVSCL